MSDLELKKIYPPGPSVGPAFSVPETYMSEEARLIAQSFSVRINELERRVMDHEQRFDTLQTPLWKRLWFKIDGWPYYDLNGTQQHRPWHRGRW
jgi:hypothetical protein